MMDRTDDNRERDRENLKWMMEEMNAKMDPSHKKMMAILDANHERIIAPLGKAEVTDFKTNPEEMEYVAEHQEIPKEDAAVMPVEEPRKGRRVRNLAAERRQKMRERNREIVDKGESWLPPAGRCPAVQRGMAKKELL
jgi:hypothetical protein